MTYEQGREELSLIADAHEADVRSSCAPDIAIRDQETGEDFDVIGDDDMPLHPGEVSLSAVPGSLACYPAAVRVPRRTAPESRGRTERDSCRPG